MTYFRYTKENLEEAVAKSFSIEDVARILLGKTLTGHQHQHIQKMITKFNIDSSHFLGWRHNLGKPSLRRKGIIVLFIVGRRQKSFLLKQALNESHIPYRCQICSIN